MDLPPSQHVEKILLYCHGPLPARETESCRESRLLRQNSTREKKKRAQGHATRGGITSRECPRRRNPPKCLWLLLDSTRSRAIHLQPNPFLLRAHAFAEPDAASRSIVRLAPTSPDPLPSPAELGYRKGLTSSKAARLEEAQEPPGEPRGDGGGARASIRRTGAVVRGRRIGAVVWGRRIGVASFLGAEQHADASKSNSCIAQHAESSRSNSGKEQRACASSSKRQARSVITLSMKSWIAISRTCSINLEILLHQTWRRFMSRMTQML
uniref:Uncharacterized protein n=1 Tax=Leersia perrieri TaxID=77586 RepID=A0A0D9WHV7_9ORYZ